MISRRCEGKENWNGKKGMMWEEEERETDRQTEEERARERQTDRQRGSLIRGSGERKRLGEERMMALEYEEQGRGRKREREEEMGEKDGE
ncbi:hypothetical protein Pcinc_035787 [Petrolisthes cinctipes]|uniref:Uncharacterized protein n=1 Tax=Petrolisthes cinctipes TaxID=88211 RepID=A0AAE1BVU3_PETCI|nr:hypothetical protein Pcinc_035787 [Petrolisthes cinctipes]